MKHNRILLTGFMGSGKTTVAKELAKKLGYPLADTDDMITELEGKTVSEIFKEKGEAYFRALEHRVTFNLTKNYDIVVSGGGGYIMTNSVYQLAASNFNIVYIDTPFELCMKHLKGGKTKRPLAAGKTEEQLREVYDYRRDIYAVRCDIIVDGSKSAAEIADEVIEKLTEKPE